ncbi:hypothetical protein EJ04DRAFT_405841, partial [Polyplosphaeria fusca]
SFLPRGQDSDDTPSQAAARREQTVISRTHRVERRAGEDPSSTPSLSAIMRVQQQLVQQSPSFTGPSGRQLNAAATQLAQSSQTVAATSSSLSSVPTFMPINDEPDVFVLERIEDDDEHRGRGRSASMSQTVRSRPSSTIMAGSSRPGSPHSHIEGPTPNDPYFVCTECTIPRAKGRRVNIDPAPPVCQYCDPYIDEEWGTPIENEMKWCIHCNQDKSRNTFFKEGVYNKDEREFRWCLDCRYMDLSQVWSPSQHRTPDFEYEMSEQLGASPSASPTIGSPISSSYPMSSRRIVSPRAGRNPGENERFRRDNKARFKDPDPTIDTADPDWEQKPALTVDDYQLLKDFGKRMRNEKLETCSRCQEQWFHMGLNINGVCTGCIKVDKDREPDEPFLYSKENVADPLPMPLDLPELSQIEEMLIARVHCFVEVRQIRGVQFKYCGHIVNFLNNTAKVYNTLPLLPSDLDVIIIRPKNAEASDNLGRQFRPHYRVSRSKVKKWLDFLRAHHSGYRNIVVHNENLAALPEDAFVDDQLMIHELAEETDTRNLNVSDDQYDDPKRAAVPDLHAENDEVTEIHRRL